MASGGATPQIEPLQRYAKDPEGTTVIPASKRPDGTWRKPIRVKEGFVPQEEIPVYKTRQEITKPNFPNVPYGFNPVAEIEEKSKAPSKNAKKRAKQKEKKAKEAASLADDAAQQLGSLEIGAKR